MKMKIRVKIMDQTDHHFEVDDQMLLSEFRVEVSERLHIPPERQRMIFAGHVLKAENSTLSACGLRDGHVVHVVERPANMPFPPQASESNNVNDHHQHNFRHGRLFQNMFGSPMNGRERVSYVIPFERTGILAENAHIEELIQSALDRLTFLTSDQRRRIVTHWESDDVLRISLPSQRTLHVASPSLERVALIETLFEHIAHFYQIVEVPGGIVDRIDEFLEGSHTYDAENTSALNEQLRADALSLEREPVIRSRLIDQLADEEEVVDESDEHAARFQRVEGTNGSAGYVMRHAITYDLVHILRRLHDEYERLRPHMIRFERILNSRILYNIDDAEHTDTDYRANFFTVYMEHVQRVLHRLSHVWHLTSDLGVYLHNPMPRRLLPNYQNFQLLPPTEGEIVLEFREREGHATGNEPASRFLDIPPPGSDVQELTNEEVRIIGLNPTVRRMQQMGIAVPIPVTAVGHVNVQAGGSNPHRMVVQRHSTPMHRNPSAPWAQNTISGFDSTIRAASRPPPGFSSSSVPHSHSTPTQGLQARRPRETQSPVADGPNNVVPTSSDSNSPPLEEMLMRAIEQNPPSLESSNLYERIMAALLQRAGDPDFDMNNVFRDIASNLAVHNGETQTERTSSTGHPCEQSSSSPSQAPDEQSSVPSLGTLARGVVTQSGSQLPFMSEVISNIMRNNGINGAASPHVDVIVEYGEGGPHPGMSHMQPQLFDLSAGGVSEQRGHPTAVGYHVEVHQFDVFTQPVGPDPTQTSSQPNIPSNTHAPSASLNFSTLPNVAGGSTPVRGGFVQGGQRQLGSANNLPIFMGNMGFPSEMHVTAPRQEVVNVDPFLSCTSRFTDVQRVLRSSYPGSATSLSPYRRFMRDTPISPLGANRRSTPIDSFELVQIGLNSYRDVLVNDEENFREFMQLAIRSAMSQMVHCDQDRNAQNARGIAPHVFSVGQSVQAPSGGEVVESTMTAPILVRAEVETHSDVHADSSSADESLQNIIATNTNGGLSEQHNFVVHEDESRSILMEMAHASTLRFDTRLITILEASGAPTSMSRPGNEAGLLRHLEALLLNFATINDLANLMNLDMTPLESHRSRFRAHVIENQLNGNSTPTDEDLLSASERLATPHSSIASAISASGGEVERAWNDRMLSIPRTIRNVEIATIQQLLRSLLNRSISDAEFSRRIQNILRDYVRHLVALANYTFINADGASYVTIACEVLMNGDISTETADENLTRLIHLRRFILPRIAVLLRDQGPYPNLDEIPSRLLAWTAHNDCTRSDVPSISDVHSSGDEHQVRNAVPNGVSEEAYVDSHDELEPSTSQCCFEMSGTSRRTGTGAGGEEAQSDGSQLRVYNGDWRRSFPDWVETIECDALSGQTNPRRVQNPSDMYQMAYPENARRQIVHEHASEEGVLSSAVQEIVGNVFRGNIPTTVHENMNSVTALDALSELMDVAIQHRVQEDSDYNPVRYPNIARQFSKDYK
ncbi:hypothetical protein KIN20_024708 [Parelaphostrongylus tenuis]|uniref:BCL2-associated athanogene 6 n=1 Tax=Parelaphostrongylus tenuis TaxID=148309 RepID=A0AAD5QXN2_PARTN|nr:hypothetical protein KIN20_024708 [Parelaphostrongylus tenuis]